MLYLIKQISSQWAGNVSQWLQCPGSSDVTCPDGWATESVQFACSTAYKGVVPNSALGEAYYENALPVVELRLAQAGVRLAAALNRMWG